MIPEELATLLSEAASMVSREPRGHLVRSLRVRILRCLGHSSPGNGVAALSVALVRRASLSIHCVRIALPLWDELRPSDNGPRDILSLTEQVLARTVSIELAVQRRHRFTAYATDLGGEYPDDMRAAVAYAACLALRTSLLDELALDDDHDDEGLDLECVDAAYTVSSILAGGWLGDPKSNREFRRTFWTWYLAKGVPNLFQ